jgi:hypothetical protein
MTHLRWPLTVGSAWIILTLVSQANAQDSNLGLRRPASDNEMRAAYCMAQTSEAFKHGQMDMPSAATIAELNVLPKSDPRVIAANKIISANNTLASKFNSFRTYVLLTLSRNVDPLGILAAEKRGAEDQRRFIAIVDAAHCPSSQVDPSMQCFIHTLDDPEIKLIERRGEPCDDPSWLPF